MTRQSNEDYRKDLAKLRRRNQKITEAVEVAKLRLRINLLEQIIITLLAHNAHNFVGGSEWAKRMIDKIEENKS